MHIIQKQILSNLQLRGSLPYKLSTVGKLINVDHPQKVKHHLRHLEKQGLIKFDPITNSIKLRGENNNNSCPILSIPIYGSANCGLPLAQADDIAQGVLKISERLVSSKSRNLIALKAIGNSMNKATIGPRKHNIEEGDYIIIDTDQKAPKAGDYILSVIDDGANIKKLEVDDKNQYILLKSESTTEYHPIIIHEEDNYHVGGVVVDILKKPNN